MTELIVNADDFGQSTGITRGVVEAHERGIVTSASLMVRWPSATEAAGYARRHDTLGVGLHVDLGEFRLDGNTWVPVYQVVDLHDDTAVSAEVRAQLETFRQLMGREPTHLDSHQHVHLEEPVRSTVRRLGQELGIPVRHFSPRVRYCGAFYGQDEHGMSRPEWITADHLLALIGGLPDGVTEMACHPAADADLQSQYLDERTAELQVLCDSRVVDAARRITLRPFRPDDCGDVRPRSTA